VDASGDAYVTGYTVSTNFPTKNPLQPANGGGVDAFVAEINPSGSALVYSTYLGGSGNDNATGIAVDSAGNAYVTGETTSTDFPTKNPLEPTYFGNGDAFVTKLDPAGSALVYSTYLDVALDYDYASGNAIAADSGGNAYVTGILYTTFCNRGSCFYYAFVYKINPTGSAFVYGTDLGKSYSAGNGIAVDSSGSAFVVGITNGRAFVGKLDASGSGVGPLTYFGGNSVGYGVATDGSDNAYVTGATYSTKFPTKNPLQPAYAGAGDAFVAKVDMRLVTKTTLTSSPNPSAQGQAVTFTAVVTSNAGAPPDGETVSFVEGKTVLGTRMLSGGSASFATSTLKVGTNRNQAVYGGDSNLAGSKSNTVAQVVN
jgi:hypothetical protein